MIGFRMKQARQVAARRWRVRRLWWPEEHLVVLRKTNVSCSCVMCGNPRKYFNEITMQEKKANISEREQLGEVGI